MYTSIIMHKRYAIYTCMCMYLHVLMHLTALVLLKAIKTETRGMVYIIAIEDF